MVNKQSNKTALIFGSTGLIGNEICKLLLEAPEYSEVKIFVRNITDLEHPKLKQIVTDFDRLEDYKHELMGDQIFICLGTTLAKAGSKEAFFKVDYTYSFEAARIASVNQVDQLLVVTAIGSDENSLFYYSKVKGKLEKAIQKLNFKSINIFRPSLLLGDRKEIRQGESIAMRISGTMGFLFKGILKKYKPIEAQEVAKAMIAVAANPKVGLKIFEYEDMEKLIW